MALPAELTTILARSKLSPSEYIDHIMREDLDNPRRTSQRLKDGFISEKDLEFLRNNLDGWTIHDNPAPDIPFIEKGSHIFVASKEAFGLMPSLCKDFIIVDVNVEYSEIYIAPYECKYKRIWDTYCLSILYDRSKKHEMAWRKYLANHMEGERPYDNLVTSVWLYLFDTEVRITPNMPDYDIGKYAIVRRSKAKYGLTGSLYYNFFGVSAKQISLFSKIISVFYRIGVMETEHHIFIRSVGAPQMRDLYFQERGRITRLVREARDIHKSISYDIRKHNPLSSYRARDVKEVRRYCSRHEYVGRQCAKDYFARTGKKIEWKTAIRYLRRYKIHLRESS